MLGAVREGVQQGVQRAVGTAPGAAGRGSGPRSGTFSERAYEELLDAILEQRLAPGARLVPEELARQLGVSVTPVKFAMARLAAEGLVEERSPYRTVVTRLEAEALAALYDARLLLETAAVRERPAGLTAAFVARLSHAAEAYREAVARMAADPAPGRLRRQLVDADRAFHRVIVALAENPHVSRWYELANTHIQANRAVHAAVALRRSVAEHDAILAAAGAGDARRMVRAVRAHIAAARARAAAQLAGPPPPALRPIARQR
ncbi:MAG TPA: GntR family transcriptional regulator [Chloroflexota bacterium]|nr:GntR family transcriptional regulator [Chloroflexota bacterium]